MKPRTELTTENTEYAEERALTTKQFCHRLWQNSEGFKKGNSLFPNCAKTISQQCWQQLLEKTSLSLLRNCKLN